MRRRCGAKAPAVDPRELAARADAEVLIEQHRNLIAYYESRIARAEGTAAAAITIAVTLAALMVTAGKTVEQTHTTLKWIAIALLGCVCLLALYVRSVRLHLGRGRGAGPLLSTESRDFRAALDALDKLDELDLTTVSPMEVRERVLRVCRERVRDSHASATSKDRGATAAAILLAISLVPTGIFALNLL
jgi:hypothetical protein